MAPFFVSEHELPPVEFTREEITYLQTLMNQERSSWFDYLFEIEEEDKYQNEIDYARERYQFVRSLRDKVYHMNGRDTLAKGVHEQRWWDQRHNYE